MSMPALSIRQPYAELILRGVKRIEYRSQPTSRRGRVYIYASQTPGDETAWAQAQLQPGELPTGVLVGTVKIIACTHSGMRWHWHLADPQRLEPPLKPQKRPNVTWFRPFSGAGPQQR